MPMPDINHTDDCEREWRLWGECFHNADGKRIPILHAVQFQVQPAKGRRHDDHE